MRFLLVIQKKFLAQYVKSSRHFRAKSSMALISFKVSSANRSPSDLIFGPWNLGSSKYSMRSEIALSRSHLTFACLMSGPRVGLIMVDPGSIISGVDATRLRLYWLWRQFWYFFDFGFCYFIAIVLFVIFIIVCIFQWSAQ